MSQKQKTLKLSKPNSLEPSSHDIYHPRFGNMPSNPNLSDNASSESSFNIDDDK